MPSLPPTPRRALQGGRWCRPPGRHLGVQGSTWGRAWPPAQGSLSPAKLDRGEHWGGQEAARADPGPHLLQHTLQAETNGGGGRAAYGSLWAISVGFLHRPWPRAGPGGCDFLLMLSLPLPKTRGMWRSRGVHPKTTAVKRETGKGLDTGGHFLHQCLGAPLSDPSPVQTPPRPAAGPETGLEEGAGDVRRVRGPLVVMGTWTERGATCAALEARPGSRDARDPPC